MSDYEYKATQQGSDADMGVPVGSYAEFTENLKRERRRRAPRPSIKADTTRFVFCAPAPCLRLKLVCVV